MTRSLTTAVKNHLATNEIKPVHLITIGFGTPQNITDCVHNLTSSVSGSSVTYTSNSFLAAELINQIEGIPLSVPFYLLSINTALSRINDKKHFLSDVVFGAAVGISIGKGFKILRIEKTDQRLKDDLEKDFYIHFRWLI